MKISHSLTVHVTKETFINCYHNGNGHSCTFIDAGESLSICFDRSCIEKLTETITRLQEVQQILVEQKHRQILREFEQLSLPSKMLVANNDKDPEEVKIVF